MAEDQEKDAPVSAGNIVLSGEVQQSEPAPEEVVTPEPEVQAVHALPPTRTQILQTLASLPDEKLEEIYNSLQAEEPRP